MAKHRTNATSQLTSSQPILCIVDTVLFEVNTPPLLRAKNRLFKNAIFRLFQKYPTTVDFSTCAVNTPPLVKDPKFSKGGGDLPRIERYADSIHERLPWSSEELSSWSSLLLKLASPEFIATIATREFKDLSLSLWRLWSSSDVNVLALSLSWEDSLQLSLPSSTIVFASSIIFLN